MREIWKDIPGYEGRYQASTLGRIRSVDRYVPCGAGGKGTRFVKGIVLKPAGQRKDPHLRVVLGHKEKGLCVHYLVARTFIGERPDGMDVRHLDGDPLNNAVENLAYGSRTDNILDVYRVGRPWRTLTVESVRAIRARLEAGELGKDLAKEFGVTPTCISSIKTGRAYSWLT